jgi:hypothetical protein
MRLDGIRGFFSDLLFDLRERKLLPAVVALGVAIVAVPFVLGGSDSSAPPASQPAPDVIETQPAVAVASDDGVRDSDERLTGRAPKNPFRQQLQSLPKSGEIADSGAAQDATEVATAADQLADQLAGVSGSGTTGGSEPSGDVADPGTDSPDTDTGEPVKTKTKTITKKIVKLERRSLWVRFGELGERRPVKGLESLDVLPAKGDPVLVLLGVDGDDQKAMFDVSSNVKAVWGKGKCAPDKDDCDYLTLKPGEGVKLRYQAGEGVEPVIYSLTLVRISTKRVNA